MSIGLRSFSFFALLYMFTSSVVLDYTILMMYKQIGVLYSFDDKFLTTVGSIINIGNALGRLIWGVLINKYSIKLIFVLVIVG